MKTMFLVATLLLLGLTPPALAEPVRVTVRETAIRLRPDSNSDVIETVAMGAVLERVAKEGDWYGVLLPMQKGQAPRFGFVPATAVESFDAPRAGSENIKPLVGQPPPAGPAQSDADWFVSRPGTKEGPIIGVLMPYTRFGLRGAAQAARDADPFPLPATLGPGYGIGATFGRRSVRKSVSVSFTQSRHAVVAPAPPVAGGTTARRSLRTEAFYNRLNLDGARFWLTRKRIQPFLAIGGGLVWLKVREATTVDGRPTDSFVLGVGGELGSGVAFHVHPRVAVQSGLIYRLDYYAGVHEGSQGWRAVNGSLHDRGFQGRSGLTFTF